MRERKLFQPENLAALAKIMRKNARKTKAQVARELGVNRATIQQAEEMPELSLTKLRIRLIETYSPYQVQGPVYWLKRSGKRRAVATTARN